MPLTSREDPRRTFPESSRAEEACQLVESLQRRLVEALEEVAEQYGDPGFEPVDWLRDEGRHGGGRRYATAQSAVFNRASINVSTVHYDDMPDKALGSATALSAIIHPDNPHAPSVHTHISWTELRDGNGYWRLMADLNPSVEAPGLSQRFDTMLRTVANDHFDHGQQQGERYFYIPALQRHRGVSHFYLEGFDSGDFDADRRFAAEFGEAVIDCYAAIFSETLAQHGTPSKEARARQLAYHTVYFFQVLTLDRGTTSGLLVHDQNDVGILASLPAFVDRGLLASWRPKMQKPQDELVDALIDALPDADPCPVTDEVRGRLARVVRQHYHTYPEALKLQARGDVIPPTVKNHGPVTKDETTE